MQGQADGETLDLLENNFKWQRNERFIRSLTDSVIDLNTACGNKRKRWSVQGC